MAPNQLSEKLDQISGAELDIHFDEAAVWSKLEARLDRRKRIVSPWWAAVACIVLFIFFPHIFLKETPPVQVAEIKSSEPVLIAQQDVEIQSREVSIKEHMAPLPLHEVPLKRTKVSMAPLSIVPKLYPIEKIVEKRALQFAAEDISIIQANLEEPGIEQGRTMTIRAQWQKSPAKSNVEYQALKIKLYEKEN